MSDIKKGVKGHIDPSKESGLYGTVRANSFKIYYVMWLLQRNSFFPVFHGEITRESDHETQLEITSKLDGSSKFFMVVWLTMASFIGIIAILAYMTDPSLNLYKSLGLAATAAGLVFVGMVFVHVCFHWGLSYSEEKLFSLIGEQRGDENKNLS